MESIERLRGRWCSFDSPAPYLQKQPLPENEVGYEQPLRMRIARSPHLVEDFHHHLCFLLHTDQNVNQLHAYRISEKLRIGDDRATNNVLAE